MTQSDALSRRTGHEEGVNNENKDVVLLPEEIFNANAINTELHDKIKKNRQRDEALVEFISGNKTKTQHPTWGKPEDWKEEEGFLCFKDRIYVPPDENLRREVVKLHHDPPVMGHPGIQKTMELVQRTYIWDGMRKFIAQYVKGCAACQTFKVNTHPTKTGLMPIPHGGDPRPFQTITIDYITDLPPIDGYDAIQVVVDHDVTKAVVYSKCNKTITAVGASNLLWNDVFSRFGLPSKIISDRGPQFAASAFQELHNQLGIKTSLSTAYHPQTDGQTERVNQELEGALRIYCGNDPASWASKLKELEFAHNHRTHSVTKKSPFELLYGYQPDIGTNVRTQAKHPNTEERLRNLKECRENALASHTIAAELMQRRAPQLSVPFKKGDRVLLEATHLKLPYPYRKFAPRRQGPFTITEVIGPMTYKLALPQSWKIHPVFHAILLTPYHSTKEHGPNETHPPPDLIEDEEEHEVEAILNHRVHRGRTQYFVAWKGWEPSENSWEPEGHLRNASRILNDYKKKHRL